MGPKTTETTRESSPAAGELTAALTDRISASLLPGDTPFARDKVADAAGFLLGASLNRMPGEAIVTLVSASDQRRFMRIAIVNEDMPFLVVSVVFGPIRPAPAGPVALL